MLRRMGKHRLNWILGVGLLASGCGDDGPTGDGGSGSSSGTEGTMGTTMQPTTMQPTTEAMTSAATSTGPDDSTTAAADSSGTAGESSSGSTGPAATGSSSSGDPPEDPAYPPCMPDADPVCPEPYDHCYAFFPEGFSACSQMCEEDGDCPQPQSGDAPAVCAGINDDECVLDCAGGAACPDDMECVEVAAGIERCAWPDA
jgi:hypothetical protein